MYRRSHQSDSFLDASIFPNSPFKHSYDYFDSQRSTCDSESIDVPNLCSFQNGPEVHNSSPLFTNVPFLHDFEPFDDNPFDPTNFSQVEDLDLHAESGNFFSNLFWHLDSNSNDDIRQNSDSNPTQFYNENDSHIRKYSFRHKQPFPDSSFTKSPYIDKPRNINNDLTYSFDSNGDSGTFIPDVISSTDAKPSPNISPINPQKLGRKPKPLRLTEDEKFILKNEGVVIPENVRTLTKTEERHIKQVKRRIKNKLSAAESRKRKRDYLDGLEERVQQTTSLNCELHKRVGELEKQNLDLIMNVKRMKTYISSYLPTFPKNNSALYLFVIAFALFSIPSWISISNSFLQPTLINQKRIVFGSRTLLSEDVSSTQDNFMFYQKHNENIMKQVETQKDGNTFEISENLIVDKNHDYQPLPTRIIDFEVI